MASESTSCLPAGVWPQIDRRNCFRLMWSLPAVSAIFVAVSGASVSASVITLAASLLIASVTDISSRKIYNWTTYPLVVAAVVLAVGVSILEQLGHSAAWLGGVGLGDSLAGIIGCGAITFTAYIASRGGAGDVKLAAGVGGMLGLQMGVAVVATAYVLAASFVVVGSMVDGKLASLIVGLLRRIINHFTALCPPASESQAAELSKTVPLAGFFALATGLVILWG